jgi:hypothetical protein
MRDIKKELEAIEKGKEWMRRSVNMVHDYRHAENVSKHSQEVFNEFRKKGLVVEEDRNITLLAVWWHDSYKAQFERENLLYGLIFEGAESAKIFKREVGHLLSEDVLKKASDIIKYHNFQTPLFLLWRSKYTPLFRTLYESDYMEGYNSTRIKESRQVYGFFFELLSKVYFKVYPLFMNLLPQSEYLKDYLSKNKMK